MSVSLKYRPDLRNCHPMDVTTMRHPALTGRISEAIINSEINLMNELAQKECVPCKGGTPPLKGNELAQIAQKLGGGWQVVEGHHLEKEYKFKNFREALDFTNKVGELAEKVGHHPDIYLAWGKVKLTMWTHSINGLTEGDFIFAAKVNEL